MSITKNTSINQFLNSGMSDTKVYACQNEEKNNKTHFYTTFNGDAVNSYLNHRIICGDYSWFYGK